MHQKAPPTKKNTLSLHRQSRTTTNKQKNQPQKKTTTLQKNINHETWRQILQVTIAILTVIAGMFFETKTQAMTVLLGLN